MKSLVITMTLALVVSACATPHNPRYRVNEVVVNNNTSESVRDVTIRSEDSVFSCGNIAPFGICSNRFAGYVSRTDQVQIEWSLGNDAPRSESLQAKVPASTSIGRTLRVVVEIQPQGDIELRFRPNSPNP